MDTAQSPTSPTAPGAGPIPPAGDTPNNATGMFMAPRIDVVFKLLFGDIAHPEHVVAFLRTVVADLPDEEFAEVQVVDPHARAQHPGDKLAVLDVRLVTTSGQIVNIEIQLDVRRGFRDRVVYGLSKTIAAQLAAGEPYSRLRRTIEIAIAGDPVVDGPGYHTEFRFRSQQGIEFSHLAEIHTLELGKLPDTDDGTDLLEWLRFLTIDSEEELDMAIQTASEPVRRVAARLKELSEDEANRLIAEARLREWRDQRMREEDEHDKGVAEGKAEGFARGLAEGKAEERAANIRAAIAGGLSRDLVARIFSAAEADIDTIAGTASTP
jgi:predicted transposase/invertase (TIGR01784 family)